MRVCDAATHEKPRDCWSAPQKSSIMPHARICPQPEIFTPSRLSALRPPTAMPRAYRLACPELGE